MRTALLPLMLLASPAFAGSFTAPEGCTAHLTVQSRGCSVSIFYTCEKDAKGNQWRADFGFEGQFYLSMIDSETQWIESYDIDSTGAAPPARESLDANPKDPASFSELVDNGLDTFDFNLTKDSGEQTHVVGFDKLTGKIRRDRRRDAETDGIRIHPDRHVGHRAAPFQGPRIHQRRFPHLLFGSLRMGRRGWLLGHDRRRADLVHAAGRAWIWLYHTAFRMRRADVVVFTPDAPDGGPRP